METLNNPLASSGNNGVRVDSSNINALIDSVGRAVEEMRAKMEEGLEDVVRREEVDRMNSTIGDVIKEIDNFNAKLVLKDFSPSGSNDSDTPEMKAFREDFKEWVIRGERETQVKEAYQHGGVMAAMTIGSNPDGGFTAPVEWDRKMTDKLEIASPMRRYASIQTVKGQGFTHLFNLHGTKAYWVDETDPRPKTENSKFSTYAYGFNEIYANVPVSQHTLEDSEIDIAAYVAGEVELAFAQEEGEVFLKGTGNKQPKGILKYTAQDEASAAVKHPLGAIKETKTGDANSLTADGLIDLIYSLPTQRLTRNSALYMNRTTHATLRKMKDGQGNYLWQPPFQAGQPAQVLGYGVRELDGMPDVAANVIPVIFGDMAQGYRIFDRVGTQIIRDHLTEKPYVLFYVRRRVGSGLWNPEFLRYHRVTA